MMEYWNNGKIGTAGNTVQPIPFTRYSILPPTIPPFQYSIIPFFLYSIIPSFHYPPFKT
jgi:hypothetical protein